MENRIRRSLALWSIFVALAAAAPADAAGARVGAGQSQVASRRQSAAEEQLAAKYAPIVMVKAQKEPCDGDGESFVPSPVELILGDPNVALERNAGAADAAADPVVLMGPTAADLFANDETLYLDFPGNPRNPGCDYEQYFAPRMANRPAVTYAHIVVSRALGATVLQYWFYFPFNEFNNTHESDWEMIQLLFEASTVEEALTNEPTQIAFAQHGDGETAAWSDPKLQKDGSHPIVYTAAGSHASQYGSAVYLGWGENGTGFGCDVTTGPSVRVPLEARLVPGTITDPNSPVAWLTFGGRWGERQAWEYNGPKGPNLNRIWSRPVTWQRGLRDSSLAVPVAKTLGPAPTDFFCDATKYGSLLLTRFKVYPWLIGIGLALALGITVGLLAVGWPILREAASIYRQQIPIFAALGLMLIPLGIAANGFQYLVVTYPPGRLIFEVMNESPGARLAAALAVGSVQQLVGLIVVGPAVIQAVADIQAGRSPGFRRSYRVVFEQIGRLARAVLRPVLIVGALALTVVGLPWAVARQVRWLFVAQAVILDGAVPRTATELSARAVSGRWWRTAGIALLLVVVGALPGPILGVFLLIFAAASVGFVNGLSSIIYAVSLPLSVLGFTVLYQRLKTRRERGPAVPRTASETSPAEATWSTQPRRG